MSNWYVGQKVVCIDNVGVREYLTNGTVYTVEEVHFCCNDNPTLGVGLLASVPCFCTWCNAPKETRMIGFGSTRFRPLDSLSEQVERIEEEAVSAPAEVETVPA